MITNQNFGPVMQGDTFRIDFTLQDADGTPMQLSEMSGATMLWYWSRHPGGGSLGTPVTALLVDGGSGEAVAQVAVPTTDVGKFFYELELTLFGDVTTMATGVFFVSPQMVAAAPEGAGL